MSQDPKILLFCELESNADLGSWPHYQQWLGRAPAYGLQVEQARLFPELTEQLERADALFLCSPDSLHGEEVQALIREQIFKGKKVAAVFSHASATDHVRSFWSGLGLEITNRGIYPLDPPPHSDHPQSLYLKESDQGNALALALLAGLDRQEFSSADRLECSEDWSPAFELPRKDYCDYLRGEDQFDFFPETGNPYLGATRCFGSNEPSVFFSTNAFMRDGFTSVGGYATSGYRENRAIANRLLQWLAGDLSAVESRTERIRAVWFRFETLLHHQIRGIMSAQFGPEWTQSQLPKSLRDKLDQQVAKHASGEADDTHFYFTDYETIIRHHWDLFSAEWPWLSTLSKTCLKREFGSLNHSVRTPSAHPARLGDTGISDEHFDLLKTYLSHLNGQ